MLNEGPQIYNPTAEKAMPKIFLSHFENQRLALKKSFISVAHSSLKMPLTSSVLG
jgi:hypothetical protein